LSVCMFVRPISSLISVFLCLQVSFCVNVFVNLSSVFLLTFLRPDWVPSYFVCLFVRSLK
jgi:hypothetical protein